MKLYLSVILICGLIFGAIGYAVSSVIFGLGKFDVPLAVLDNIVGAIAIDGLFAFIIRRLPGKWFSHEKKLFCVSPREKNFYEKIKIRKWKDKIPELGQFTDFHKDKIADPHNNVYLTRYMLEAAYGEVIHFVCLFLGFAVILFHPHCWYWLGLPVAIINALLNLPSVFILRYNFYKLKAVYAFNERRANRQEGKE